MHRRRTVSGTSETVTNAHEGSWSAAVKPGKLQDLGNGNSCFCRRPLRVAVFQVFSKFLRTVRVLLEIVPVCVIFLEQHMHHRTGKGSVGAGTKFQVKIRFFRSIGPVGIDHHQLCVPGPPSLLKLVHDVDLGVDRISTPNHQKFTLGNLPSVGTAFFPGPGIPA